MRGRVYQAMVEEMGHHVNGDTIERTHASWDRCCRTAALDTSQNVDCDFVWRGGEVSEDELERKHTLNETGAEREDGLNQGPEHESLLSAVKICETTEEEKEAAGAEGKCGNEPLKLVGGDPKVLADGRKGNSCGRVCRSLRDGSGQLSELRFLLARD